HERPSLRGHRPHDTRTGPGGRAARAPHRPADAGPTRPPGHGAPHPLPPRRGRAGGVGRELDGPGHATARGRGHPAGRPGESAPRPPPAADPRGHGDPPVNGAPVATDPRRNGFILITVLWLLVALGAVGLDASLRMRTER